MSRPVVVLPDVEAAIKALLTARLAARPDAVVTGCKVWVGDDPKTNPKIHVVRVSGSIATPAHDNPLIDFRVWHNRPDQAMELARIAAAELRSVEGAAAGAARVTFDTELMGPTRTIDPVDGNTPQVFFRHQFFIR